MAALSGSLEDMAKGLGDKVLSQFKSDFQSSWDEVSDDVKDLLTEVTQDAGRLAVKQIHGEDVSEEMQHIQVQLLNLKVAGEILAVRTFWQSFGKVMSLIGEGLGALASAGLKAISGGLV